MNFKWWSRALMALCLGSLHVWAAGVRPASATVMLWATGDDGTILHSTDAGGTWTPQSSGTTLDLIEVDFVDSQHGWALEKNGRVLRTSDGGGSWTRLSSFGYGASGAIDFVDVDLGWAAGSPFYGVAHTSDGGDNWSGQSNFVNPSGGKLPTGYLREIEMLDSQYGWFYNSDQDLVRTTDGGATWELLPSVAPYGTSMLQFVDSQNGWSVGSTVRRTYDGGATWTTQTASGGAGAFLDADTGWIVGGSGSIESTLDGGVHWLPQTSGVTSDLLGIAFLDSDTGWAVGEDGVILHTLDGGQTWSLQTSGTTEDLLAIAVAQVVTVPEPACMLLALIGFMVLFGARRRYFG